MRLFKRILRYLGYVVGIVVIFLGVYVLYVTLQYNRIEDNYDLAEDITASAELDSVSLDTSYTVSTYNIGFGAYTRDYTFFMDTGMMADGTKTQGTSGKAKNKDTVLTNTNGAIDLVNEYNCDFMLFQEVDVDATRSYGVNQYQMIQDANDDCDAVIGINFNSAYLAYPLFDNHGKTLAGIVTLSRFSIASSIRYQLPVDDSFPTKFFDLDRCFTLSRIDIEGSNKDLVLINAHLSAYDEGGIIRAQQLETLMTILEQEKENYVVLGGDFNHDIADSDGIFPSQQLRPDWLQIFDKNALIDGYAFATSANAPTCRGTDIAYEAGVTYSVVVDGFIVSNNVEVESVTNIDENTNGDDVLFMYSDHNPVVMKFKLKS